MFPIARRVSDEASPEHVPETARIAVFDNDGTLWPEVPLPFQVAFIADTLRQRLDGEPALQSDPMVTALLAGDVATLMHGADFMRVWSKRVYGIPPEQVVGEREYAYDARPPSTGRLVEALEEAARRGWIVVDV